VTHQRRSGGLLSAQKLNGGLVAQECDGSARRRSRRMRRRPSERRRHDEPVRLPGRHNPRKRRWRGWCAAHAFRTVAFDSREGPWGLSSPRLFRGNGYGTELSKCQHRLQKVARNVPNHMADENAPDRSAAEAFEQLRSEVALLRRAVEGMAAASVESAAPDYSPTLAGLRKAIDGVGTQIEVLTANPPVTSLQLAAGIAAAAAHGRSEGQREMTQAKGALEKGVRDLAAVAGAIHAVRVDRRKLIMASVGAAVVGVSAWIGLSGPIARALPDAWQLPERMAAATLHLPRWQAGSRLMAQADATAWSALTDGGELMRANAGAIRACRTKASRSARPVSCQIEVAPS